MNTSLITPPPGDISVQLVSQLLGPHWYDFLSASSTAATGSTSMLGKLFQVSDLALLAFVSALLIWQVSIGAMQTAHEGVALGRRYHSIWAPIRAPSAFVMLTPLPWLKGFSLLQALLLFAVYQGIGVADAVWTRFVDTVQQQHGVVQMYPQDQQAVASTIGRALIVAVTQEYIGQKTDTALHGVGWHWVGGNDHGRWVWRVGATQFQSNPAMSTGGGLGEISFPCSAYQGKSGWSWIWAHVGRAVQQMSPGQSPTPVKDTPVCQAQRTAMTITLRSIYKLASSIVQNPGQPPLSRFSSIVNQYAAGEEAVQSVAKKGAATAESASLRSFATQAKAAGWASSAFYWWTLMNANAEAAAAVRSTNVRVTLPATRAVGLLTSGRQDAYIKVVRQYLARALDSPSGGGSKTKSDGGHGYLAKRLFALPKVLTTGNVMANMVSYGGDLIGVGESMIVGYSAARALVGTVAQLGGAAVGAVGGEAVDPAGGGVVAGIGGYAAGSAVKKLLISGAQLAVKGLAQPVVVMLGVGLVVEGAVLAYVIPMLPAAIMTLAIIGWLLLVVELMVAAPLWAAAHAFAEGEGFAPSQARHGYAMAAGVIMRPPLLTFGFIFAFLLTGISGRFVGTALDVYLHSMVQSSVGPVAFVAIIAAVVGLLITMIRMIVGLIVHLAQYVPGWISASGGGDLGVDQAAQNAMQHGEGRGRAVAAGAGAALGSGATSAADALKKDKNKHGSDKGPADNAPVKEAEAKAEAEGTKD